ncbi:hypothetical protein G6O69_21750 [Pseudenhygromyxa sp. WMMC2535]|uniref:tetratricopeptide repeat protein n=1 Tax=Pseudenhygromyxa sp. WMMC2535 TaxID=2712867 RepID=UPI001554BFBA|nr:hypothetical protein [Pseudenhygromyxa sp. WMMC2535]NVB40480.1 hypothetical protein [Pseudenhygromyxa sp. WMMC2535]
MRPSSAPALKSFFLLAVATLAATATISTQGCDKGQPEPSKVEKVNPFDRGQKPKSDSDSPLRNPEFEAPAGREGEQLDDEALEAALAEAAEHLAVKNVALARSVLRQCANKIPASARCDGELGLSMAKVKNRRAAAHYYMVEAAKIDDPKADADLYLRLADALRSRGEFEAAQSALEKVISRDPSAENIFTLGQVLSLQPEHLDEAVARIAEARAKDDRLAWLYEEAVIRAQIPVREEVEAAAALLRTYLERAATLPEGERERDTAMVEGRLAELSAIAEKYPTRAQWEQQQAEAGEKKESAGEAGEGGAKAPGGAAAPQ